MGRGAAGLVAENMALIKAWLIESNNPIRGTDQSGKEFWSRVHKSWKNFLQGETDARVKTARDQRGFEALSKQWAKMVAGMLEFSSCIVKAKLAKPTGIASHADLVSCAEGIFCGTNVYGRIRGDNADDVASLCAPSTAPNTVPVGTVLGAAEGPGPIQVGGRRVCGPPEERGERADSCRDEGGGACRVGRRWTSS